MAKETNGWTPNLIKQYVDAMAEKDEKRYADLRAADDLRYQQLRDQTARAVETALTAAGTAMDKALETSTARFESIDTKLDELAKVQTSAIAHGAGVNQSWIWLVGAITVLGVIANTILMAI